jgi:hypothetical protein
MSFSRFRTTTRLALTALVAGAVAGPLLGCSAGEPTASTRASAAVARLANIPTGNQPSDRAALDDAMLRVRAIATTSGCGPGGCEVIGLGAKACGGPREYVAYCPTSTDVTQLKAAAAEVQRAERAYNERYNITVSDCSVAPLPSDRCVGDPPAGRAP